MSARTSLLEMYAIGGRDTPYTWSLQQWPTGVLQRTWHATGHLVEYHLLTVWWKKCEFWKTRIYRKQKLKKNVDTGSHLSNLVIFYTLFLSSYNQQLLLQPHRSGSSDTRAELSISQYPAHKRIHSLPRFSDEGRGFLKKHASIWTVYWCVADTTELPLAF